MKIQTEGIVLENKSKQRLKIYKINDSDSFCIGLEGENEHFEFMGSDADEITNSINIIVNSFA